jgi:hypothetical protein
MVSQESERVTVKKELKVDKVDVQAGGAESGGGARRLLLYGMQSEYRYATTGLLVGLACIIIGAFLCYGGVAGHTNFVAKLMGFAGMQASVTDAPPGVILLVIGLFIVGVTRPRIKIGEIKG